MNLIRIVLAAAVVAAAAPALPTVFASHGVSECTTPGTNQPCQIYCDVGDFVHVKVTRSTFGSVHGTVSCGDASASCLETFAYECSAKSLTPATKRDIGLCNTDTTDSVATCWTSTLAG